MITPSFSPTATERVLPKLALDFTTASLDSRITLTRALNTATCVNSSGNVAVVNANLPRFDYDPSTLACKGLLIEESRTNSIRNNTAAGAVAGSPGTAPTNWVITTTTGVFTRTIVGTGTENGIDYVDIRYQTSGAGTAEVLYEGLNVIAAASGQSWTASNYVKLVGGSLTNISSIYTLVFGRNAANNATTEVATGVFTPTSSSLISQRNVKTIALANASTAFITCGVDITFSGAGDVTLRFGLPQLELGAFATSVIKTSSGAVTRNADVATMTGTNFSSWFNASEGALFVDVNRPLSVPSGQFPVNAIIYDGTTANSIKNGFVVDTLASFEVTNGGVTQAGLFPVASGTSRKVIGAYKLNNFGASFNGNAVSGDSLGTVPTVNQMVIGSRSSADFLNGTVKKILYWPQRITNAELQAFSK